MPTNHEETPEQPIDEEPAAALNKKKRKMSDFFAATHFS
jgi:hypothetical protein